MTERADTSASRKRASRPPQHHPADDLSFTRMRPRSEWRGTNLLPRCWWSVAPSGDYRADCATGTKMALEYLAYINGEASTGGCLGLIVQEMPRELSGIEVAFLTMLDIAAKAGQARAVRVSAFWDQREAADAAKERAPL